MDRADGDIRGTGTLVKSCEELGVVFPAEAGRISGTGRGSLGKIEGEGDLAADVGHGKFLGRHLQTDAIQKKRPVHQFFSGMELDSPLRRQLPFRCCLLERPGKDIDEGVDESIQSSPGQYAGEAPLPFGRGKIRQ